MLTLTRPEGTKSGDLSLSRRALGGALFGGYAVFALSAEAEPIVTSAEGLRTETVALAASDRFIPAYVARPEARGRYPAVVVVSEVFGVHEYIRDVCRRLARLGYVAIAPDFFIRRGDPSTMTDFNEIRKIVAQASEDQVMGDLEATLAYLKAQPFVERRRMAVVGFCWGGAVAWLASARFRDFKAAAAWYGRLSAPKPGDFLGEPERHWPLQLAGQFHAPVLGLYGGKDAGIPQSDIEAMRAALAAAKETDSEIVVYPEAQHGFHADYRSSFDPGAANDGWMRMLAHFKAHGVEPRAFVR